MTDTRDPSRKLLADVVRFKRQAREAREELARKAQVLDALRADAIAFRLGGRLRVEDFRLFIGVDEVVTADGGLDGRRLEVLVADLLHRRPELAVSRADSGVGR